MLKPNQEPQQEHDEEPSIGEVVSQLFDEGKAYADKLREAGVPVTYENVEGVFHAFFGQTNIVSEIATRKLADAAAAIKAV